SSMEIVVGASAPAVPPALAEAPAPGKPPLPGEPLPSKGPADEPAVPPAPPPPAAAARELPLAPESSTTLETARPPTSAPPPRALPPDAPPPELPLAPFAPAEFAAPAALLSAPCRPAAPASLEPSAAAGSTSNNASNCFASTRVIRC